MEKKHYTLEEAKKLLPKIKPLLKKLIQCHLGAGIHENLSIIYEDTYRNMQQTVKEAKQWHKLHYDFFSILDELHELGVLVQDSSVGLIDFYSSYEGKEILLCYRYPEKTVSYWHELEAGFVGRQSVKILEKVS